MEPRIQTRSAGVIRFDAPAESVFTLDDIAHGLSNTCRYSGQCEFFYSVAQHAVLVSYIVGGLDSFIGLHHDDTEAFMCDIPTPLKRLLPDYEAIEWKMHCAIFDRLGLQYDLPDDVKAADHYALALEKPILIGTSSITWKIPTLTDHSWDDLRAYIKPMTPAEAKQLWLDRHAELVSTLNIKTKLL